MKILTIVAILASFALPALAQVPPNLGQPGGATANGSDGKIINSQIPYGSVTGTVADGGVANQAATNATAANTAAAAAQATANAACPKSGCTMTGFNIDGTMLHVSQSAATYTLPAGTDWVVFTQTGLLGALTITLPTTPTFQTLELDFTGPITALAFSPAVAGWTNGSLIAGNIGLTLFWDSTTSSYRRHG